MPQRRFRSHTIDAAAHDVAKLKHVLIGQRVVNEQPLFSATDEPQRVQELKVLGQVRLVQVRSLTKISHGALTRAERVENAQPGGFTERSKAVGDLVEQF